MGVVPYGTAFFGMVMFPSPVVPLCPVITSASVVVADDLFFVIVMFVICALVMFSLIARLTVDPLSVVAGKVVVSGVGEGCTVKGGVGLGIMVGAYVGVGESLAVGDGFGVRVGVAVGVGLCVDNPVSESNISVYVVLLEKTNVTL